MLLLATTDVGALYHFDPEVYLGPEVNSAAHLNFGLEAHVLAKMYRWVNSSECINMYSAK